MPLKDKLKLAAWCCVFVLFSAALFTADAVFAHLMNACTHGC